MRFSSPGLNFLKAIRPEAKILLTTFTLSFASGYIAAQIFPHDQNEAVSVVAGGLMSNGFMARKELEGRWDLSADFKTFETFHHFARVANFSGLILGAAAGTVTHAETSADAKAMRLAFTMIALAEAIDVARHYRAYAPSLN